MIECICLNVKKIPAIITSLQNCTGVPNMCGKWLPRASHSLACPHWVS